MKRSIILLLCMIMLSLTLISVAADEVQGEALSVELLKYYRYETEQIVVMVDGQRTAWRDYLGELNSSLRYDLMYQVYYLDMKDIVAAYDIDGSFGKNISDKYYWVVPNYEKGTEVQVVRNADAEFGWAIRRGTRYMEAIGANHEGTVFGIAAIYDNILKKSPDVNKLSLKMVYDELNDIHLMYFTAKGEEYVVPYFASTDITWIKNEEVYSVRDYVELMRANTVKETHSVIPDDDNKGTEAIYLNYIVVGTITVIGVALIAVIIAQKKGKPSEEQKEKSENKE